MVKNIKTKIKKIFTLCFLTLLLTQLNCLAKNQPLHLKHVKCSGWSLKSEFLEDLINLFGTTIFVESGTYTGGTTSRAAELFDEVHSIELKNQLYQQAKQKLQSKSNVHLYLGDSSKVLPQILPQLQGKILFWLDGHYSGGPTAKGKKNTPIIEELQAIKESGIKNAVILIDDLRCFQPFEETHGNPILEGYPTASELKNLVLEINKDYLFEVFGDIAIAYPKSSEATVSPVVHACTISRLSNNKEELNLAEKTISEAKHDEKTAIKLLYDSFVRSSKYGLGKHYHLWYALTLAADGKIGEAIRILRQSKNFGFSCEQIPYYLALFEEKND